MDFPCTTNHHVAECQSAQPPNARRIDLKTADPFQNLPFPIHLLPASDSSLASNLQASRVRVD